jgi:hypothetical protein
MGLPSSGTRGLGLPPVIGRSRVPSPPAIRIALMLVPSHGRNSRRCFSRAYYLLPGAKYV